MITMDMPARTKNYHYPVLSEEAAQLLDIKSRMVVVDCTLGMGSHAAKFLDAMHPEAVYVGMDRDEESIGIACEKIKLQGRKIFCVKSDFAYLDRALEDLNIPAADVFFFDLGISSYQLNSDDRGFSFLKDGPLDMRMDRSSFVNASDLVNNLSEEELSGVFFKFGEERYSRRIARLIVEERRKEPISTTSRLSRITIQALPRASFKYKIHPAARVFQALRIAVNRELEILRIGIEKAACLLKPCGRIGVISFHSLEDRIVKHTFRDLASQKGFRVITKKPVVASSRERGENIASRSAKLRVIERAK